MLQIDSLMEKSLLGCSDDIKDQFIEILSLTEYTEDKQHTLATNYRWNKDDMDHYMSDCKVKWQADKYFLSGRDLGLFNRILYNIEWKHDSPSK